MLCFATTTNLAADEITYDDHINSLINVLNKPWFSRAWIVQESALSVLPVILLSSEEVDFRLLHCLVVVVATVEAEIIGPSTMRSSKVLRSRGAQTLHHVETCRQETTSPRQNPLKFLNILRRLAFSMDATDARDQVYAFLAFQVPHRDQIVPDYSLNTSVTYTTISASIARSTESLSILGLVRGTLYPGLLPTWAIDWRLNKSTQGVPFDGDSRFLFNACKGYRYRPLEDSLQLPNGLKRSYSIVTGTSDRFELFKVLSVRGKVIGRVTVVSTVIHEAQQQAPDGWKLEQVIESLISGSRSQAIFNLPPSSHSDLIRRVLAVLIAEDVRSSVSANRENEFEKMLQAYHNYQRVTQNTAISGESSYLGKLARILARKTYICVGKRVFCSGDNLMGLGPQHIRELDIVCILHGSKVPCILRKHDHGWKVIGQCFYEGWMHGELVDWKEEEGDAFDLV